MVPFLTEQDLHILSESKARLTVLGVLMERLMGRHKDRGYFHKHGASLYGHLQQKQQLDSSGSRTQCADELCIINNLLNKQDVTDSPASPFSFPAI